MDEQRATLVLESYALKEGRAITTVRVSRWEEIWVLIGECDSVTSLVVMVNSDGETINKGYKKVKFKVNNYDSKPTAQLMREVVLGVCLLPLNLLLSAIWPKQPDHADYSWDRPVPDAVERYLDQF